MFFCKYNDPIYVKKEKLDILVKLDSDRNVDQVLLELKEYASEVDVDFVRKAVRTIGRCAIKLEIAAERCIKVHNRHDTYANKRGSGVASEVVDGHVAGGHSGSDVATGRAQSGLAHQHCRYSCRRKHGRAVLVIVANHRSSGEKS